MISFLRGTIFDVSQETVIVEVGGIGYQVTVHSKEATLLRKGEGAFLYTCLVVREDLVQLFGFLSPEGLHLFKTLISASGIGPKTALAITGATSYRDFAAAIFRDDLSYLVRLPGVGKKTGQKLLVELKDKLSQDDFTVSTGEFSAPAAGIVEAREALEGLGFSLAEVEDFLQEALKEKGPGAASDVLVQHVLQRLGGRLG